MYKEVLKYVENQKILGVNVGGKKKIMKIKLTEEQYKKIIKEGSKGGNYMFFSNLKQMRRRKLI